MTCKHSWKPLLDETAYDYECDDCGIKGMECHECDGDGIITIIPDCGSCDGTGMEDEVEEIYCGDCSGDGYYEDEYTCEECDGTGILEAP